MRSVGKRRVEMTFCYWQGNLWLIRSRIRLQLSWLHRKLLTFGEALLNRKVGHYRKSSGQDCYQSSAMCAARGVVSGSWSLLDKLGWWHPAQNAETTEIRFLDSQNLWAGSARPNSSVGPSASWTTHWFELRCWWWRRFCIRWYVPTNCRWRGWLNDSDRCSICLKKRAVSCTLSVVCMDGGG